jgi:hypothetical protein
MGAITGLLGLGGGTAGTSAPAAALAPIATPTTAGQATQAYNQTQQGLQGQQALLSALQSQGGLGLQNQAAQGYSNLAQGIGPNPAQAMLAQQTGANVAQTAALQAGQRGAAANVGLLARQAGQQGAATQQAAVGQAATLQANQQIAGLQGLAGQANTIAGQQIGQTNANTQAQQAQYANVLNALGQQNQTQVSNQASVNSANAALANTQLQGQQSTIGGVLGGASTGFGLLAKGGEVGMAYGGPTLGVDTNVMPQAPTETFPQFLSRVMPASTQPQQQQAPAQTGAGALEQGVSKATSAAIQGIGAALAAAKGGMVNVILSPGEKEVRPQQAQKVAAGGKLEAKTIPGKAKVKGDSYANDVFHTKVPEGTIIVPRSKAGNEKDTIEFVRTQLAKRRDKK